MVGCVNVMIVMSMYRVITSTGAIHNRRCAPSLMLSPSNCSVWRPELFVPYLAIASHFYIIRAHMHKLSGYPDLSSYVYV